MSANTTGPAELRRLAFAFPEELPQLSARAGALIAAWEADIARAERAEAALDESRRELMAKPTPYEWVEINQALNFANRRADGLASYLNSVGADIAGERARTLARNVELADLLTEFIDDSPCRFDHHGYCQTHDSAPPCLMERARAALAPDGAR